MRIKLASEALRRGSRSHEGQNDSLITSNWQCDDQCDISKDNGTYFGISLDTRKHEDESNAGENERHEHTGLVNLNT